VLENIIGIGFEPAMNLDKDVTSKDLMGMIKVVISKVQNKKMKASYGHQLITM